MMGLRESTRERLFVVADLLVDIVCVILCIILVAVPPALLLIASICVGYGAAYLTGLGWWLGGPISLGMLVWLVLHVLRQIMKRTRVARAILLGQRPEEAFDRYQGSGR